MFLLCCEFEVFVALDAAGADLDATCAKSCSRLWECYPLKVWILASITTRVELCSTNTVRVASGHSTSFFTKLADV